MTKRAGSQGGMIPTSGFVLGREMFLPETTLQSRRDSEGSKSEAFFLTTCVRSARGVYSQLPPQHAGYVKQKCDAEQESRWQGMEPAVQ